LNIAWWNLENLFDHETAQRDPELKSTLKSELKGWTADIRDRKISQLAIIIRLMFNNEVIEAKTAGERIPDDVAYDSEGRSTTDPGTAMKGALRSFDRG
jgi:hypothetical protein